MRAQCDRHPAIFFSVLRRQLPERIFYVNSCDSRSVRETCAAASNVLTRSSTATGSSTSSCYSRTSTASTKAGKTCPRSCDCSPSMVSSSTGETVLVKKPVGTHRSVCPSRGRPRRVSSAQSGVARSCRGVRPVVSAAGCPPPGPSRSIRRRGPDSFQLYRSWLDGRGARRCPLLVRGSRSLSTRYGVGQTACSVAATLARALQHGKPPLSMSELVAGYL